MEISINKGNGMSDSPQASNSSSGFGWGAMISSGLDKAFNKKEAKKSRAWSERQNRRRYQIAVDDMRKAGLNPILAAGGSFGASSAPSAAVAAGSTSGDPQISGSVAENHRNERELMKKQMENVVAQTNSAKAQEFMYRTQGGLNISNAELSDAQKGKTIQDVNINKPLENFSSSTGATANMAGQAVNTALEAFKLFKGKKGK